jgi:hypothetical protein
MKLEQKEEQARLAARSGVADGVLEMRAAAMQMRAAVMETRAAVIEMRVAVMEMQAAVGWRERFVAMSRR